MRMVATLRMRWVAVGSMGSGKLNQASLRNRLSSL